MNLEPYRRYLAAHRLPIAIIIAICIAIMLTSVSMSLYVRSGASRLDLSRPGYEKVREQVSEEKDEDSFSASGPMNSKVIDEFQEIYSKRRANLDKLDPFNPSVIDDTSIRLLPSTVSPQQ